ncbi:MAG: hypothetical protein ACPGUV_15495, partial [Polyangiales bacterium]
MQWRRALLALVMAPWVVADRAAPLQVHLSLSGWLQQQLGPVWALPLGVLWLAAAIVALLCWRDARSLPKKQAGKRRWSLWSAVALVQLVSHALPLVVAALAFPALAHGSIEGESLYDSLSATAPAALFAVLFAALVVDLLSWLLWLGLSVSLWRL